MNRKATVNASPSLALIKYWGKKNSTKNIPASSSLALTLDTLKTTTVITLSDSEPAADFISVNDAKQDIKRYAAFFNAVRMKTGYQGSFTASSKNNFPTSAGLASSASGFAALAMGAAELLQPGMSRKNISALARIGSASAARAVFGGAAILRRGAQYARPLEVSGVWKDIRIIAVCTNTGEKPVSSREAMELVRKTSPFYRAWLNDSEKVFKAAIKAWHASDIGKMGELMRASYLSMFSTMFTAKPAVMYWLPESLQVIGLCAELRRKGIPAWETMDAGPQVKILTDKNNSETVQAEIRDMNPKLRLFEDRIGGSPQVRVE